MHQSPDILASFGDWETRMERALASVRAGRGVLVVDDEDRENEGDLIYPAHSLTDAQMARLIRHCSGIVCLCLTDERATRLGLPPMVATTPIPSRPLSPSPSRPPRASPPAFPPPTG